MTPIVTSNVYCVAGGLLASLGAVAMIVQTRIVIPCYHTGAVLCKDVWGTGMCLYMCAVVARLQEVF